MEWKNKLYDHEVLPPENLWGKINHDLDNDSFITFKQKLFHYEISPPENLWSKISHDLDNDSLITFKEKLFHSEVSPPENLWDKINHDLNNDSFVTFKEKFFHHEEVPPSEAWKNIEEVLHPRAAVVPLTKRNSLKVWRIAAAAAIIGIAFVTVNYFLSQTNETMLPVAKKPAINTPATPTHESEQPLAPPHKISSATIASRFVPGRLRSNPNRGNSYNAPVYSNDDNEIIASLSTIPAKNAAFTDRLDLSTETTRRIPDLRGEIKEDVSLLDLPNSYFLMTGPNGQTVRVSSKFRNTIQYLNNSNNEELLDVILRESHYWKNIFSEWKTQVGNSSFVPSSQNFMGIAELMNLLQQNRNNK